MKLNLAMVLRKLALATVKSLLGSSSHARRQPEAGLERLAASFSSRRGAVPVTSSRFPPASVNSFFASLKEKNRGDFLSATSHFFNRQM